MRSPSAGESLTGYVRAHSEPPDPVARSLISATAALGDPAMMQVSPEQAAFLAMIVRLTASRRIVEVGTFTGYSALAMASAMPRDGRMICCDLSVAWGRIAVDHWRAAGLADRIELRIGLALDALRQLPGGEWIDLAFIDADKGNYIAYYEELVPRIRSGGVILADNVLAGGLVVRGAEPGSVADAMHRFNDHVLADPRTESMILPIADGLSLLRKR